jgi:hypothetical protein
MVYAMFSGDDGADVGRDGGTNVSPHYKESGYAFTGKIDRVTIGTT